MIDNVIAEMRYRAANEILGQHLLWILEPLTILDGAEFAKTVGRLEGGDDVEQALANVLKRAMSVDIPALAE